MKRRYYYRVQVNNSACEFDTLKEAKAYIEEHRQPDGTFGYSVTNSLGKTFKMKAEIELTKHWEYVNE